MSSQAITEAISTWRDRPDLFSRDVLGKRLVPFQTRILQALRTHRRVAVKSGHGVGKTFLAAVAVRWWLLSGGRVITTATTWPQVRNVLWAEIARQGRTARVPLDEELLETRLRTATGEAYGLSTDQPDAFQGSHVGRQLVIFDEAQGIAPEIWTAAESLMSGGETRWLAIANPTSPSGPFFEACRRPDLWHVESISCLDHPNVVTGREVIAGAVSREWVEERRREYGEGSGLWRSRILGEFPEEGDDTLITLAMLEASEQAAPTAKDGAHLGVDIARFGSDQSVATLIRDRVVVDQARWQGIDLMATTGRVLALMREWNVPAENVHLDVCGIGGGVVDRLREQGYAVDPVDFGAGPRRDWSGTTGTMEFKNRRAELYWAARCLLKDRQLSVPKRFAATLADLSAPRFKYDSGSRVVLESKDEIRARLGRSPDSGDSLIIALSRRPVSCGVRFM